MSSHTVSNDDYEALLQFLYVVPVGLLQTSIDGDISMINPVSAKLLMPLSPDAGLDNLFTVLESVAPDLRSLIASFAPPRGTVCDGRHIALPVRAPGVSAPGMLSLSILKLDASRLVAVISDITSQVKRAGDTLNADSAVSSVADNSPTSNLGKYP